jgi:hypothetical protein
MSLVYSTAIETPALVYCARMLMEERDLRKNKEE